MTVQRTHQKQDAEPHGLVLWGRHIINVRPGEVHDGGLTGPHDDSENQEAPEPLCQPTANGAQRPNHKAPACEHAQLTC